MTSLFPEISPQTRAIQRLQAFVPAEGYYLAFSGGKDSICLKHLADMARVKYDAHYNITSADPPELIMFIRQHHPDVIFDRPATTMWKLIPQKLMPPTRRVRYCCEVLKEVGGEGRVVAIGIRAAESASRSRRKIVENCTKKGKVLVSPIIDWSDEDTWGHIRQFNLSYPSLYDEGWKRLGCIGCPLSGNQKKELERWPKYKEMYLRAFAKMMEERKRKGKKTDMWKTPEDVMDWFLMENVIGPNEDSLKE